MNDTSRLWNMPWHALQRHIAKDFVRHSTLGAGRVAGKLAGAGAGFSGGDRQRSVAFAANSWLDRSRRGVELRSVL